MKWNVLGLQEDPCPFKRRRIEIKPMNAWTPRSGIFQGFESMTLAINREKSETSWRLYGGIIDKYS